MSILGQVVQFYLWDNVMNLQRIDRMDKKKSSKLLVIIYIYFARWTCRFLCSVYSFINIIIITITFCVIIIKIIII